MRERDTGAIRYLRRWITTQLRGSPLDDEVPWITFRAQRALDFLLGNVGRAFEYGTGGSTLYLANRIPELVSVEHDPEWFESVATRLGDRDQRVELQLRTPSVVDVEDLYQSTGAQYRGTSFKEYASSIDRFPDSWFDLILIDGRARVACFKHAMSKVRRGGHILLDNSERSEYEPILDSAKNAGWECAHFPGPGPYVATFWRTTIMRRPARDAEGQDRALPKL